MSSAAQSGDKQKTDTSFGQSLKDISKKALSVEFNSTTIARLGQAKGKDIAIVAKPRAHNLCRECVMGPSGEQVGLKRVRDHFIFKSESTGEVQEGDI